MLQGIPSIDAVLREGSVDPGELVDYIGSLGSELGDQGVDEFLKKACDDKQAPAENLGRELVSGTVIDVLKKLGKVLTAETLVNGFVLAACETRKKMEEFLNEGQFPTDLIHRSDLDPLGIESTYGWIKKEWFLENAWMNWLRIIGIVAPVDYETVHNKAGYNLIEKSNHSDFSYFVASYGREFINHMLLNNKDILTIGGGNGRDEAFWAKKSESRVDVNSIRMIEGSPSALDLMRKTKQGIHGKNKEKLIIPDQPEEMFEALRKMKERGETFDTIYGLSVFHYFDDHKFKELFGLMKDCLRPGGYIAFSVKAPKTTFDGVGIPLITLQEDLLSKLDGVAPTNRIHQRYFLNLDGQTRAFRDLDAIKDLVKSLGFEMVHFGLDGVESDYEFSQQGEQYFARFIIKKPKTV